METSEKKIARVSRIPGLLNWARQNFARADKTQQSLQRIADSKIQISLGAVYALCAKLAYKKISYEDAFEKAQAYEGFPGKSAREILPVFSDYISQRQIEAVADFEGFQIPFPIGKRPDNGKTLYIPIRPTFVTILEGKLRPIFLVGWVDSPLDFHQRRLIAAIIRRAILTQQDFIGCDVEIVSFARKKFSSARQLGVWKISQIPDYSDEELISQFDRYTTALRNVINFLNDSASDSY